MSVDSTEPLVVLLTLLSPKLMLVAIRQSEEWNST
jgi:hypothetical protein